MLNTHNLMNVVVWVVLHSRVGKEKGHRERGDREVQIINGNVVVSRTCQKIISVVTFIQRAQKMHKYI